MSSRPGLVSGASSRLGGLKVGKEGGEDGMVGALKRRVGEGEEGKRRSVVLTPTSLRPPAIVSPDLYTLTKPKLDRINTNHEPSPVRVDPTKHPFFRPPSDNDQGPNLLFLIDRYAFDIAVVTLNSG